MNTSGRGGTVAGVELKDSSRLDDLTNNLGQYYVMGLILNIVW